MIAGIVVWLMLFIGMLSVNTGVVCQHVVKVGLVCQKQPSLMLRDFVSHLKNVVQHFDHISFQIIDQGLNLP